MRSRVGHVRKASELDKSEFQDVLTGTTRLPMSSKLPADEESAIQSDRLNGDTFITEPLYNNSILEERGQGKPMNLQQFF